MFIITVNTLLLVILIFIVLYAMIAINGHARYEYACNDFDASPLPSGSIARYVGPIPPDYKHGWELVGITCFSTTINCVWRRRL
jgi:hypothetical protein